MHISAAAGLENDSAEEHRLRAMSTSFSFTASSPLRASHFAFPKFATQPPSVRVPSVPAPFSVGVASAPTERMPGFSFGSAATPSAQSFSFGFSTAALAAPPPPTFSFKFGGAAVDAEQPAPAFSFASTSFSLQTPPCVSVRISSGFIGAKLSGGSDGCGAVVSSVVEGGAAAVAGVRKGFFLQKVNNVDVLSQPLLSVLSSIKAALASTSDSSPAEFRFSCPSDNVHESACTYK